MKRKEDAEARTKEETAEQKSVERSHWTIDEPAQPTTVKTKFIVEYDLSSSTHAVVGRQSYSTAKKPQAPATKIPKLEGESKDMVIE